MSKNQTIYICSKCDAQYPKWSGRCLECGSWNTLVAEIDNGKKETVEVSPAKILNLADVQSKNLERLTTSIAEFDRVMGGGIVPGSLTLLSGEPGIGKSTIVGQIADMIGKNSDVIYVSGEESASQLKNRLERIGCDLKNIKYVSETEVEKIISALKAEKPTLVIIDSIQTVYTDLATGEAGSLSQIRASATRFLEIAKSENIAFVLIGHITKDGSIAGPKSLEHIVDVVLYFETEELHNYRIIRSTKNRFGTVNEIGIFDMTSSGFMEIKNPAAVFLDENQENVAGSVISCIIEGTRPFLIEVQALVTKTVFGYPQRKASGFDLNRLQVLVAVLTKRAKINLTNQDVILNIVGGQRISDPSLDLPVCFAIASSLSNQTIDRKTLIIGEVGLGGEIRNVSKLERRLAEAEKLGYKKALTGESTIKNSKIKLDKIKNISEIVKYLS